MIRTIGASTLSIFALLVVVFAGGCSHRMDCTIAPCSDYAAKPKIPAAVRVAYAPDFAQTGWRWEYMGDTWDYPMGAVLTRSTDALARAVFANVDAKAASGPQGVLTAKVVALSQDMPGAGNAPQHMVVAIEWQLADQAGRPIWVATVQGEGTAKMGGESRMNERAALVVNSLFRKSFETMQASPEIREWAATSK
jgi:hypothetical protein